MNPHLAPVEVPDPAALGQVQRLCDLADPYATGAEADGLFAAAMAEANAWHTERSPFLAALLQDQAEIPAPTVGDGVRTPLVPAAFFKRHEALSVPRDEVFLHLTSSGTTGQKSQMFFDRWTIRSAQRMVARIFDHYGWITPDRPVNYLLYSYEPAPSLKLGTSFTDNYLCDFAPARHTTHALRHTGSGHEFDVHGCIAALQRYADDDAPVRILGFPAFLYFTLERMRSTGMAPLRLPEGSLVVLGGGWKGHADRQIGKDELRAAVTERLGIPAESVRDTFGSVEHCVPYVECAHHRLHVPVWSRAAVRDPGTLRPLAYGEPGFLHLVSPYITSVPAHSVVMGDLASLHPGEECPCPLSTDWFTVLGRAGVSRNRSCAVAAAEMMKGMS
ncbi:acyl-protein synthase [Streptomyces sp. SID8366]|uniref:LuxE/PaaK family acyltransferase n=1 Tax=unclassified Streptomyces TaxID=2593676 RepID=UPI000DB99866|nr:MULTISPECIES: acyl-protein synthase [unclassified Streptomyces]MYU05639.1 acyl-protein synthase [Streptomyces sp. SID8366]MYU65966.1 acyl-protein synthase [Streptomyces sp. SID69]RAJ63689.1 acyl-protein synthetase LuxE [Streptomyces sp. PsTaAH-130]